MEGLDKIITSLGFNEKSVKDFGSAIPFQSRKLEIMRQIREASEAESWTPDFYALFYILSIAFSVLVLRLFVLTEEKTILLISILTDLMINYSNQLLDGFKILSLLVSVLICTGIYLLVHHLKNEKKFC